MGLTVLASPWVVWLSLGWVAAGCGSGIGTSLAGLHGAAAPDAVGDDGAGDDGVAEAAASRSLAVAPDAPVVRHAPSGMLFPARLAGLARDAAASVDPRGDDVAVGYHRIDDMLVLAATVYVYPAQGSLERDFAAAEAAVLEQRPGAILVAEGSVALRQDGRWHDGRRAHFLVRDPTGRQPAQVTHVFLFQHGPWRLKYRATFLAGQQVLADRAIVRLLRELPWPELDLGQVARAD